MKKLNARQEKYCEARAAGKSRRQAYQDAGYSPAGSTRTAEQNAWTMETKSSRATEIQLKIEELRSRSAETAILNREDRLRLLSELAAREDVKPQDRIRAADQIARMQGDYNDRLTVSASASVSMTYADRIEAIRAGLQEDA